MPYPHLLSKLQMGPGTLRNRVAMAPMTRGRAGPERTVTDMMVKYYAQRASAGLIISEGLTTSILGRGWFQTPDLFTHEHAKAWKKVTDAVHAKGGKIFAQLWHTGRVSHSNFRDGIDGYEGDMKLAVAPSAIKKKSENGKQMFTMIPGEVDIETPRELSHKEVKDLAEEFCNAAEVAKLAGFDGVEVHCANGYLLDTFLQSYTNERTDEYGGSMENRFRLIGEVIRSVLTVFEPHQVGVKISPNGAYNDMGSEDFRESFLYYAERIAEFKLGYLHIMIGHGLGVHGKGKPMELSEFRKVYPGVIMANVDFDPDSAEKEIACGNADMVSFGRFYISNPDFVERIEAGVPLNPQPDMSVWWSAAGYVLGWGGYGDYKRYDEVQN